MVSCKTCVRRTLDCDGQRPRCSQCRRSHIKCTYDPSTAVYQFLDETNILEASSSRNKRQRTFNQPAPIEAALGSEAASQLTGHVPNHTLVYPENHAPADFDPLTMPWVDDVFEGYMDQAYIANLADELPSISQFVPLVSVANNQPPSPDHRKTPNDAHSRDQLASADGMSPSPTESSAISDHVLAQHYTRNLTGRYSSKDPGWNYYTHFYTRFSAKYPFVASSLYAWTSAHLYCTGTLNSRDNALAHYRKSVVDMEVRYGFKLLYETNQTPENWITPETIQEDCDAIAVSLYFLASTDLMLSRFTHLRCILEFEAHLIRIRSPEESGTLFAKIMTWFCFLDARASAFGSNASRVINAIGGENGLIAAMDKSQDYLQREYNLLYPSKEQKRDRAHLPLLMVTNRLVVIFGQISSIYGRADDTTRRGIRKSLDEFEETLEGLDEATAGKDGVLSSYFTTLALFHCVEIYYSRAFASSSPLYSADTHASTIIRVVERFYHVLKYPKSEPPPTKFWPIPLTMAAIEAKDPIYRGWALQKINEYKNAGEQYPQSYDFADKVQSYEDRKGSRADLSEIAGSMGPEFLI